MPQLTFSAHAVFSRIGRVPGRNGRFCQLFLTEEITIPRHTAIVYGVSASARDGDQSALSII